MHIDACRTGFGSYHWRHVTTCAGTHRLSVPQCWSTTQPHIGACALTGTPPKVSRSRGDTARHMPTLFLTRSLLEQAFSLHTRRRVQARQPFLVSTATPMKKKMSVDSTTRRGQVSGRPQPRWDRHRGRARGGLTGVAREGKGMAYQAAWEKKRHADNPVVFFDVDIQVMRACVRGCLCG